MRSIWRHACDVKSPPATPTAARVASVPPVSRACQSSVYGGLAAHMSGVFEPLTHQSVQIDHRYNASRGRRLIVTSNKAFGRWVRCSETKRADPTWIGESSS